MCFSVCVSACLWIDVALVMYVVYAVVGWCIRLVLVSLFVVRYWLLLVLILCVFVPLGLVSVVRLLHYCCWRDG